jgi:hypothetical protein
MRNLELKVGLAGLAATITFLGGCATITEDTNIEACDSYDIATDIRPTYDEAAPGYSPQTDPNLMLPIQRQVEEGRSDWGIGTLVCTKDTDRRFWHTNNEQFLTQRALYVAKSIPKNTEAPATQQPSVPSPSPSMTR